MERRVCAAPSSSSRSQRALPSGLALPSVTSFFERQVACPAAAAIASSPISAEVSSLHFHHFWRAGAATAVAMRGQLTVGGRVDL